MRADIVMPFCLLLAVVCRGDAAAAHVEGCFESEGASGTCQHIPILARSGGAMIQTKSQSNVAPQKHHQDVRDPDGLVLSLSNRVGAVDKRVTALEGRSGTGREKLQAGLDALKVDANAVSADGDAAKARVAAAEGAIDALEDVVNHNNAALKKAVDSLRSDFQALGNNVGQHWSAMLESWSERGDPQGGAALVDQVAALEGRCNTLEKESGDGRLQLKKELDALDKQIADLQAGGAGSLEHTTNRVGSAEKQVSSLAAAVDEQGAELTTGLASLKTKLGSLGKKLGSLLARDKKQSGSMVGGDAALEDPSGAVLPLSSRIDSLEKRAELLEGKSDQGRGDLQLQLDTLTDRLALIKEGGVKSLAYTVVRVTSMETEIESLTAAVEQQKTDVTAKTDALKEMFEGLVGKVGAA